MIEICKQNIRMSAGDDFNVNFKLIGIELESDDVVTFSVKEDYEDEDAEPILTKTFTGMVGDVIPINIPSSEMKVCGVGLKYYDIFVKNNENLKYTLNFPAKLYLERVAHSYE